VTYLDDITLNYMAFNTASMFIQPVTYLLAQKFYKSTFYAQNVHRGSFPQCMYKKTSSNK